MLHGTRTAISAFVLVLVVVVVVVIPILYFSLKIVRGKKIKVVLWTVFLQETAPDNFSTETGGINFGKNAENVVFYCIPTDFQLFLIRIVKFQFWMALFFKHF